MKRIHLALCLALVAGACSSSSSQRNSVGSGSGEEARGEPIQLVLTDYQSGVKMELVNESHTTRLEQYSKPRASASRKVLDDETMDGFVSYLRKRGFEKDATAGDPPYLTGGELNWTLQLARPEGEQYVAWSRNASAREQKRLATYKEAFINVYNHTQGWQAVKVEAGQLPFKGPNLKNEKERR